MKEENLIRKWLDYDLTAEELKVLEGSEDFQTLQHISDIASATNAPHFDATTSLASLQLEEKATVRSFKFATLAKIAAVIVIALGVFYFTTTLDTAIQTEYATTEKINLPDDSAVVINADTKLDYNKSSWDTNRNINLDGEAYFKVAKGEKFTVTTPGGTVQVLGTEFNVRYRDDKLEVTCFEGSVKVQSGAAAVTLEPTHKVVVQNNKIIKKYLNNNPAPSWVGGESTFVSMPFAAVIREFERQYDVTIDATRVNNDTLFTGGFMHNDISIALKTITSSMQLNYIKEGKKITLSSE